MKVKCLIDFETPTHSLKKGVIYDLQFKIAENLIKSKIVKKPTKKDLEPINVD